MLRHLRLARERGSLKAPNSPVQDRALDYLVMLDEVERSRSRLDTVKALVTHASFERVRDQFPEYFDPYEGAKGEDGEFDIDRLDDSQVDWATAGSEDDDEALSRWIQERESGSFSAADLGGLD